MLAVVGYHARLPGFAGGLGGVDVFFVISGFLIAGVIAGGQATGGFSLAGFWERRIRRILPALLVLMAATTALAWSTLPPADLIAYARSMLAALFSASNLWFWRQSDFFAPSGGGDLLLHTWSLGVEEQFYLALPLVMAAGRKWFAGRLRTVLALAALASLAACAWGAWRAPQAAFYLPATRAWELLLGVLLTLAPGLRFGPTARRSAGLAGLALIAIATLAIGPGTPLLGVAALVPCLGAALVIAAGSDSIAGRLLAWPPLVGIGLISYSLYLWHMPLLALPRLTGIGEPGPWTTAACLAVAFGLAWLSWRLVERPARNPAALTRAGVFAAAAAAVAGLTLLAVVLLAGDGFPGRAQPLQSSRASTTSS